MQTKDKLEKIKKVDEPAEGEHDVFDAPSASDKKAKVADSIAKKVSEDKSVKPKTSSKKDEGDDEEESGGEDSSDDKESGKEAAKKVVAKAAATSDKKELVK